MSFEEIEVAEVYRKNPELKKEEVALLKQWVEKQPHLPNFSEFQAALFLHSCYFRQEAAKAAVDVYFTVRTLCPDIFQFRTLKEPAIKVGMQHNLMAPLPLPNGDTMIFTIIGEVEYFNVVAGIKVFDALLQLDLRKNGPTEGLHIVVDMKNMVFGHLLKVSTSILAVKKFFYVLQEGLPVRMKYIHFVNIVSFMDKIMALIKPFLKKELLECVLLHQNVDTVFEYIPQEVFPKDYGGTAECVEALLENSIKLIKENEEFLNEADRQWVDETKRSGHPKSVNDIFGVEGSFKKLEFD